MTLQKIFSGIIAAGFSVFMAACAIPHTVDQQLVAEPDPVSLRLASAVDRASAALQTLAAVEQVRTPSASVMSVPYAPQELRRTVSVDWVGPMDTLTRRLAERAGYQMQVNGDTPPVPIVVTIKAVEKSVIEVLRDIGLQAGQRADVVVDGERRVVEINYAPVSGG